jgi:hypothetical protein
LRDGDASGLDAYDRHCSRQFEAYFDGLLERYAIERRFEESVFWRRRHEAFRLRDRTESPRPLTQKPASDECLSGD